MLPAVLVLAVAVAVVILALSDDEAGAQTVRYQEMTEEGEDPFTDPADVESDTTVPLPRGTFGGTGSDLVCDRELLIRRLREDPEKLREWARVLGIEPTEEAVARYIRGLRPVTLTRDTQVTNHSYSGGKARGYQAFLQAGSAVLVDKKGVPRVRCRCGNPLLEPVYKPTYKCLDCPPKYKPPKRCVDYKKCWRRHPEPPPVKPTGDDFGQEPGATAPTASFSPNPGKAGDEFTLSVSGFKPNATLNVIVTRPDGGEDPPRQITTGPDGTGSFTFPADPTVLTGTYSASVTDDATGDQASASVQVGESEPGTEPGRGEVPPEGTPPEGVPPEGTPPQEGMPPGGTPPSQDGLGGQSR
jgi:hypothetical protein